jgi:hypothetical protein
LCRRELVVEDDQRGVGLVDERAELVDLPFPEVRGGVGTIDLLGDAPNDDGAGGICQLLELLEVLVDVVSRGRPLARRADEQCALDRRGDGNQLSGDGTIPPCIRLSAIGYQQKL